MSVSFLKVTMTTFIIAILSTLITILIALPVSYFLARTRNNTTLLLLVVIPFWVNFLIRVYAWIAILGKAGFLNDLLMWAGIIDEPIQFLFNFWTVVIVHVYTYLPYMILPLLFDDREVRFRTSGSRAGSWSQSFGVPGHES